MTVKSNCKWCGKIITRRGKLPGVFCCIEHKAAWQRTQKPVDKEWLYQKYIVEGLTANDIAKIVKRDPKRVWEWLKGYGIPTRPRGSYAHNHGFQKGHHNEWRNYDDPAFREKLRQARLRDGHVPYLRNGIHYLKGKRGPETPNWKGGCTPERQAFYSSEEWKKIAPRVWARGSGICQRCGLDYKTVDKKEVHFHIHHVVSFTNKELRYELSNLVLLCQDCHRFVHSKVNKNKEFLKDDA